MKKILMSTMAAALLSVSAMSVQAQSMSNSQWAEIRDFLEANPGLIDQLQGMMNQGGPEEQMKRDAANIEKFSPVLFAAEDVPYVGNPEGDIVIVKFTDYSCGHCKTMNGHLKAMIEDNPRLKVRMMEYPILGERSQKAAKFALAVHMVGGDEAYAAVHNELFQAPRTLSDDYLKRTATDLGLDAEEVMNTMETPSVTARIQRSIDTALDLNITGTPGIVLNKAIVRGSVPRDQMEQILEDFYPE